MSEMLLSINDVGGARRKSLAAGMALALAGRAAALVPAATTTMRSGPIMKAGSTATATSAVRVLCTRRRGWGVATGVGSASLVHCTNGSARTRWLGRGNGARAILCSTNAGAAAVEVSADGLEIGASIKSKGDAIRDLKAGGASKDELKPHIEVQDELQLFVAAYTAHGRWT